MLKKIATLLLFPIVFACNSDDNATTTPGENSKVLLTKLTQTVYYSSDENVTVTKFNYQGDKLVNISDETLVGRLEFVYEGDKIVRANQFNNTELLGYNTISYEGNKIKTVQGSNAQKTEYTYTNDVLNTSTFFTFYDNTWTQVKKSEYTFANRNATQIVERRNFAEEEAVYKIIYGFDLKNNPMRDMNPYLKVLLSEFEGFSALNLNNTISQKSYNGLNATIPLEEYSYEIIYNSDNFPTQIIRKLAGSTTPISKTVFEYK